MEARRHNIGFAIWRLNCFYKTFVQGSRIGILLNFCAKFLAPSPSPKTLCSMKKQMKYIIAILLIMPPFLIIAQIESGWKIYKSDSLKVEKFRDEGRIKSVGTYTNGQKKYLRYLDKSQMLDTVNYFSKEQILISKVNYQDLSYTLIDSSYIINYKFVDTCIARVKEQISKSFGNSIIHDYIFLDGSNSSQDSRLFNRHMVSSSKLYEPENYPIRSCWITISTKLNNDQRIRSLIYYRIDSTMNIVQSDLDLDSKHNFNISYEFADSIKTKMNWQTELNEKQNRAIVVEGPFLEMRSKQIKWIIQRRAGNILIDGNYEIMDFADYIEELIINTETGEYEKTLKYVGIPVCH